MTVLHGRAYTDHQQTIGRLKALGQKVILVANLHNGHTSKTVESLSHEFGVDQVVIEMSGNLYRYTGCAVTRLLGLKDHPDPGNLAGIDSSATDSSTRVGVVRRRPVATPRPPTRPRHNPGGQYQSQTPTVSKKNGIPGPIDTQILPSLVFPSPPLSPTPTERLIPMATELTTASAPPQETGQVFPIEATFLELEALTRRNLSQIRESILSLRATGEWLAQLEATSARLREAINTDLAKLSEDITATDTPVDGRATSTIQEATSETTTVATIPKGRGSTGRYALTDERTISLSGTRVRQLFEILFDRRVGTSQIHTREELEQRLGVSSQVVYQAVSDLRQQLRKGIGRPLADQCFMSDSKGYRWDATPLSAN